MKVLILAGGFGKKLWPLARRDFPKPFLKILNGKSFLRLTVERLLKKFPPEDLIIITADKYRFLVNDEVGDLGIKNFLYEPENRNTAISVFTGLKFLLEKGVKEDEVVFISPSDQYVKPEWKFFEYVDLAGKVASEDYITTMGIVPSYPETEFGYIKVSPSSGKDGFNLISEFVEKPDLSSAEEFFLSGNYLWNMGVFFSRISVLLDEYRMHEKYKSLTSLEVEEILKEYSSIPAESFPRLIMEKSEKGAVIPMELSWSSLNSWYAVYHRLPQDENGNAVKGNVTLKDVKNSLFWGEDRKIVGAGVDNVVVVETRDAVFVSDLSGASRLRDIVSYLLEKGEQEVIEHKTVFRPWGSYTVLEEGEGFKLKRITVKPGGFLSLQYHNHRSEHWVVVKGKVEVEINGKRSALKPGESTFVPSGITHRLGNPFEENAEVIEVQVGEYLGEDDIVRLEDRYGRTERES